jgi:hypothetical protein
MFYETPGRSQFDTQRHAGQAAAPLAASVG